MKIKLFFDIACLSSLNIYLKIFKHLLKVDDFLQKSISVSEILMISKNNYVFFRKTFLYRKSLNNFPEDEDFL